MCEKIEWRGTVLGIQPRIALVRSFDERSHSYLGYVLRLQGRIGEEDREFLVAIGKASQEKLALRAGDVAAGRAEPLEDAKRDVAEFYKVAGLKLLERPEQAAGSPPPWTGAPPALTVYQERGHRRLSPQTYTSKCACCIWGCKMAVEMIIDQWKPNVRRYRQETFCYGPKSCRLYAAGPTRKVPGRKGMSWEEGDWVDKEATAHRGEDE